MDSNIKLTTKQAEEKMKIYREVFDVVRIIKSTDIRRMQCGQEPELNENICRCYDFGTMTSNVKTVCPKKL